MPADPTVAQVGPVGERIGNRVSSPAARRLAAALSRGAPRTASEGVIVGCCGNDGLGLRGVATVAW